ncbi:hypothetical protein DYB37_000994 [Aphanomyces astaci]|uniref:Uncharacterized protein n=1 Tax=Aphanomyces astaci TaxID=112090 RepID=A0A418F1L9_APHAT|nr:hypothetical protein DYB37_000994 [Aphanomyces astaci]
MKNRESLKRAQHVMTMLTDAGVSAGLVVSSASLALLRTSELQSVFAAPFWKLPCLAKYRHVLTTLVQIAIDRQLAPSEAAIATLSRPQLKELFVPSFRVLKLGVPMEVMSEMDTNSIAAVHKVLTATDALHP